MDPNLTQIPGWEVDANHLCQANLANLDPKINSGDAYWINGTSGF